jgi:hypothetical protein
MKSFSLYIEDRTTALIPSGGNLEDFLRSLEGRTIKQILDDSSYMSLYQMNKHGIGGARGSDKDAMDFVNKLVQFVNRDVLKHRPREREYETEQFQKENDYEGYSKARSQKARLGIERNKLRREKRKLNVGLDIDEYDATPHRSEYEKGKAGISDEDREKRNNEIDKENSELENKIDKLDDFISNHPYTRGMRMITKEYDKAVEDYHNTPLKAEYLKDDGSDRYDELVDAFTKLGGQSDSVIDV